jgi:hypothetical protein
MRILVLASASVAALALAGGAAADTFERTPFEGSFTNPCTGETFSASGMVTHQVVTQERHRGVSMTETFEFEHVEGTTANGVHYTVPNQNTLVQIVNADGSTESRFEAVQQFIRDGDDPSFPGGDDLTIRVSTLLVTDAQGNILHQDSQTTLECG